MKIKVEEIARRKGEINIHTKITKHIKDKTEVIFVVPDKAARNNFIEKIKNHPNRDEDEIELNVATIDWLQEWKNRGAKIYELSHENPIHMVVSDRSVAWGSVGNPGECTGFFSKDKEIATSFKKLFDCFTSN